MTAPVSLFASLAQPAARAAMGDAVGAGLSGFDALLAMLTQSLAGNGEAPDGEVAAQGKTPKGQAPTDQPRTEDPAMAAWLAQGGDSAMIAQALGRPLVQPSETQPAPAAPEAGGPLLNAARETSAPPVKPLIDTAPETCAVPVKSLMGAVPELAPSADPPPTVTGEPEADQPLQWGGAPPKWGAARSETDLAATLARLRETAMAGPPPAASLDSAAETPAVEAPPQAPMVATDPAQAADVAPANPAAVQPAAAPPPDPRGPGARKPGTPASAAAELKTQRQATEPADMAEAPAPVETAEAASEGPAPEPPPAEPEAAPVPTRQAERPENVTQALISRLESVAAGATALAAQVRGAPETVARLAAGILDKLEGQTTRFDLQLDPHGLGKVDVSVEIGVDGRLSAQLGFDNAQGLAELRGRAQELRQALEQAGFSLSENSLSFDFAGHQRRQEGQADTSNQSSAGQAFARALGLADDEADAAPIRYQARRGLDLLV